MARLGTLRVDDVLDYERDIKGKRMNFVHKNQVELAPKVCLLILLVIYLFEEMVNVCICANHQIARQIRIPIFILCVN